MTETKPTQVRAHVRRTKTKVVPVVQHQREVERVTRDEAAVAAAEAAAKRHHEEMAREAEELWGDDEEMSTIAPLDLNQGPWHYRANPKAHKLLPTDGPAVHHVPPNAEILDNGVIRLKRPLGGSDRDIYGLVPSAADGGDRRTDSMEAGASESREVFAVLRSRWSEFEKKIARMKKKAAKWGLQPPEVEILDDSAKTRIPLRMEGWGAEARVKYGYRPAVVAYVHAPELVAPGDWKLRAIISPVAEGHNVVAGVGRSEEPLPQDLWTTGTHCDHCGTDRNRVQMFAMQNPAGDWQQVGRSCLGDYKGLSAASAASTASWIANWWKDLSDDDDWMEKGSKGKSGAETMDVLVATVQRIDLDGGYISTKKEDLTRKIFATGTSVTEDLFGKESHKMMARARSHAGYREKAEAVLQWLRDMPPQSKEYMANLRAIGQAVAVPRKRITLLASAVTAFDNHLKWEERRQEKAEERKAKAATMSHFGEVGDAIGPKLTPADKRRGAKLHPPLKLKIKKMEPFDSQYGGGVRIMLTDDAGHQFKWWSTATPEYKNSDAIDAEYGVTNRVMGKMRWQVGDTISLQRAVIKDHDTFRGTPETVISGAKMHRVLTDPERAFVEGRIQEASKRLGAAQQAKQHLWNQAKAAAQAAYAWKEEKDRDPDSATTASAWANLRSHKEGLTADEGLLETAGVDNWDVRKTFDTMRTNFAHPRDIPDTAPERYYKLDALHVWPREEIQSEAAKEALEALEAYSQANAHEPLAKATRLVARRTA